MVAAIDHSSIVEGMRAIGATQAGLISKKNLTADLVLNVQSNLSAQILRKSKDGQNY
jgi:hypothetical protein